MLNRILIFVALFVFCNGRNVADPVFRKDYKYYDEANGWFKLHIAPMKWAGARLQCAYEGAVLVSPLNNRIQTGIVMFLQDQKPNRNVFYSGISTLFGPGLYRSIEGVTIEDMPINWSKNEPSDRQGCAVFYSNKRTMGSKSCTDNYPFICYKANQNAEMVRNECGTVDHGYQRIEGSAKCYKYHLEPTNWEVAYKICHAEGGWLAIHTDYMRKEFGQSKSQIFYVGFKLFNGVWWDVHGNPMEPYRVGKRFDCGARTWEGKFLGMDCNEPYPFLCEKLANNIV